MSRPLKYRFYATLLDAFQSYLDSDSNFERWGKDMTIDEWREKCERDLIDKINRVPFQSEAADKGTAFNEVVDCLVENRTSDKVSLSQCATMLLVCYKLFDAPSHLHRNSSVAGAAMHTVIRLLLRLIPDVFSTGRAVTSQLTAYG